MEEGQIAVSFNIVLSEKVSSELVRVQRKLAEKIKERRFYDNSPHLAICTKFMLRSVVDEYISVLERYFEDMEKFELELSSFGASKTGNYIFLNFTDETRNKIYDLNDEAKRATKGIGEETPGGLPPKYPYDPHISIIKLEESQVELALELLNDEFDIPTMLVRKLEVTVEHRDETGFATFSQDLLLKLK